jgi:plastocyanin
MGGSKLLGRGIQWLLIAVMLTLMMAGSTFAAEAVRIVKFTANATVINAGETVTLSWRVFGAARVELLGMEKQDEDILPLTGSLEVWPMATTTYTLIAYGANGNAVSQSFTVNVGARGNVKINFFIPSAIIVSAGQTVVLRWSVTNGASVRIIGIEKEDETFRPLQGSVEVWPETTTTYILEATGFNGEVTSVSITVNVVTTQAPQITSFKASPAEVRRGMMVNLSWVTQNARYCTIVTSDGITLPNRFPVGSIWIMPDVTKTYTLTAYGVNGTQTKTTLTIKVNDRFLYGWWCK